MIIENYIFDFDGTLMDTQGVILATIKKTISDLHLPPRTEAQCKSIIGIRTDDAAAVLYPELPNFNPEFAKVFRENYDILKDQIPITPFPEVLNTLAQVRNSGHPMAIATSRRHASVVEFLQGMGIEDWFEMIIGADDVVNGKPSPEPVVKILEALDWNPEKTLVVGDAPVDIMMGKGAGCYTCAVTYGNGSIEGLKAVEPDYIIDHFNELPNGGEICCRKTE